MSRGLIILAVGIRLVLACKPEDAAKCDAGKFYDCQLKICSPCVAGSYAPGNNDLTACASCEAGRYVALSPVGLVFCSMTSFIDHRYQDNAQRSICTNCPAGQ